MRASAKLENILRYFSEKCTGIPIAFCILSYISYAFDSNRNIYFCKMWEGKWKKLEKSTVSRLFLVLEIHQHGMSYWYFDFLVQPQMKEYCHYPKYLEELQWQKRFIKIFLKKEKWNVDKFIEMIYGAGFIFGKKREKRGMRTLIPDKVQVTIVKNRNRFKWSGNTDEYYYYYLTKSNKNLPTTWSITHLLLVNIPLVRSLDWY